MKNLSNETPARRLGDLATGNVGRLLLNYSLPAVVGMVVMSLYNVVDRIFIGQGVGTDAIAGLAITFPVMNISAALGILIGAGSAARVSILLGAHDMPSAEKVLGNSLVLILINATVYLACFGVFIDPILAAFGASDATLPYARTYMLWLMPGMLMMNISYSFNNVMRASGYPRRAMVTMFIGAGANVLLDPLFIYVLDMGMQGAAIATDISMALSAVFVMKHFWHRESVLRFRRGCWRLEWRIVLAIVSIGAAPSLVNLAACAINAILNRSLLVYGGDSAIAAAGIFTTYTSLLTMIVVGICQGMQPIVGYNYGAGLYNRLMRTFWLAVGASTVIVSIGAAFGLTFSPLIARAFNADDTLTAITSNAFSRAMVAFWVVGFQIVATTFFQSIGKAGRSIVLSLARQVIFMIPLLLILPPRLGLNGVWYAFPASDLLATLVTVGLIAFEFRQLKSSAPGPLTQAAINQ